MTKLSRLLAAWQAETVLPDDATLTVDIEPANLA
jgi:hypothetical protein